jgi:hypothetical protein
MIDKMKLTTQEVIKEFKKVHGDKYDYSKMKMYKFILIDEKGL